MNIYGTCASCWQRAVEDCTCLAYMMTCDAWIAVNWGQKHCDVELMTKCVNVCGRQNQSGLHRHMRSQLA
jgi:hypothetical protein